ncbi:hypothetical protein L9F63_022646 [Diploptera punctata]|uniref:MYND-type domain-containing protein n=1 Tax=Diploptera punctata TaxID=6984 RepID=A0AAD8EA81_DIPPU|nr:hypothetical protein L9F63_022646 [Diploptera punctata]
MGKRKKVSSEPKKGSLTTQEQEVDTTLKTSEENSTMVPESSGNGVMPATTVGPSKDSSTDVPCVSDLQTKPSPTVSSAETKTAIFSEMAAAMPKVDMLQKDNQSPDKNQVEEASTSKLVSEVDRGIISQETKHSNSSKKINDPKAEITKSITKTEDTVFEETLGLSDEKGKSNPGNKNYPSDQKNLKTNLLKNYNTSEIIVPVPLDSETNKPTTEKLSVNVEKDSTCTQNPGETINILSSEDSPENLSQSLSQSQSITSNLHTIISDKELKISESNVASSDNPTSDEAPQGRNLISCNQSSVLPAKGNSLQDLKMKNVIDNELHNLQPEKCMTEKADTKEEVPEKQKPSQPQVQTSSEKKSSDTDTRSGTATQVINASQKKINSSPVPLGNKQISTSDSPQTSSEIDNMAVRTGETKFQDDNSLNSDTNPQKQIVLDQVITTQKIIENETLSPTVNIQEQMDKELEGNEKLSEASKSLSVAAKSSEMEHFTEPLSQNSTKSDNTPETGVDLYTIQKGKHIPISEIDNLPNSEKSALTISNAEIVVTDTKLDMKVEVIPESDVLPKEGDISNTNASPETIPSESVKEATKKGAARNKPSKSNAKKGNMDKKSEEDNVLTGKKDTSDKTKKTQKKDVKQTKKGATDPNGATDLTKKLDDLMPKKLVSVTEVDNKEKENNVTNVDVCNISKSDKENEPSLPTNVTMQGATKKGHSEVKVIETDDKTKDKKPDIEDKEHKSSKPSKTAVESEHVPANENKQTENSIPKKSKSKKSKQKMLNIQAQNISASEDPQLKTTPGSVSKENNKTTHKSESQGQSGLIGLMQEVIEVMGRNNKGGQENEEINKNEIKKPKKPKNRRKSKPKEDSESQENDDKTKHSQDSANFVSIATQKPENNKTDTEYKNIAVQKMKSDAKVSLPEDSVKTTGKSKNVKRNVAKNEDLKQTSDGSKQNNATNKTNQPLTTSNPAPSDKLKDGAETVIDNTKDVQTVSESIQAKKKRKRRKNKSKPSGNEEDDNVVKGKNIIETASAPESLDIVKKNSNRIKSTEKIVADSSNESNANAQIKCLNLEVKPQQKVSGTLSGEQLNHMTRTAVNLSQSLGDTDGFNLKFTPDMMKSLLAPKPVDIFSSPEDDEEVEYRMVQRQIFLSYVCHVCKSMESKSCSLKKCNNCKLISYCSKKHQKDHWSAHKDMCTAITNICKREGLSHLFQNALGLAPNDYRLYRTYYANMCSQELRRELQLWEKEMIYYPQVCHTCYECDTQKLSTCQNCSHVNYCSVSHRKIDHPVWCKEFQIYRDTCLHQFHNGMIRPILPETIFEENVAVTGDMESFLSKVYNITEKSVQMSKLHFVALTEVATCPFTVLFSLQSIGFPLNDIQSLTIHLIGAEMFFEIDSIRKWEMLLLHLVPSIKVMKIVFVGPELSIDSTITKSLSETKVCQSCSSLGRNILYEFWPALYHDFMRSEMYGKPDFNMCF